MNASARAQQSDAAVVGGSVLPDAPDPGSSTDLEPQAPPPQSSGKNTCNISGTVLDTNDDVVQGGPGRDTATIDPFDARSGVEVIHFAT